MFTSLRCRIIRYISVLKVQSGLWFHRDLLGVCCGSLPACTPDCVCTESTAQGGKMHIPFLS